MSISKSNIFYLAILFISLYLGNFSISALAPVETTFDNAASSEAVTSVNDAILKSLVIISQVAVLGIIFNYSFFADFLGRKMVVLMTSYTNQSNKIPTLTQVL